nr:MAG TPA: hypothetical protein [Caudoviricetes sp.]
MITGGKRMKSLLLSGKVKPDVGGQVLDIYNQSVIQGISLPSRQPLIQQT